jgi:hypothetical protein
MKVGHQIDWEAQPLGQIADAALALRLGVSKGIVRRARLRQGLPSSCPAKSSKGINWDRVSLGTKSDTEIARELGVASTVVLNARKRRGIPRHGFPSRDVDWSKVPLGQDTDDAVALLLGTTSTTVGRHRRAFGIPPSKATYLTLEGEGGNFPEALIDLYWHEQGVSHQFQARLGKYIPDWIINDETVVEYAGLAVNDYWGEEYRTRLADKLSFYHSKGWKTLVIQPSDLEQYRPKGWPERTSDWVSPTGINWSKQPWGQMSDTSLARKLGRTQSDVSRIRRRLGHPVYQKPQRNWKSLPLGETFDHIIATKLGVSINTVRRARVALGIPAYRETLRG